MSQADDPPGWDGYNVRTDRTQVIRQHGPNGEHWVIVPHDDRPAVDMCPYCFQPLATAHFAKVVCNFVYPLNDDSQR